MSLREKWDGGGWSVERERKVKRWRETSKFDGVENELKLSDKREVGHIKIMSHFEIFYAKPKGKVNDIDREIEIEKNRREKESHI